MVNTVNTENAARTMTLGAVVFEFSSTTLPDNINYKIRLKPDQYGREDVDDEEGSTSLWYTDRQFSQEPSVGPRANNTQYAEYGGLPGKQGYMFA